jgi:hypothetical protein
MSSAWRSISRHGCAGAADWRRSAQLEQPDGERRAGRRVAADLLEPKPDERVERRRERAQAWDAVVVGPQRVDVRTLREPHGRVAADGGVAMSGATIAPIGVEGQGASHSVPPSGRAGRRGGWRRRMSTRVSAAVIAAFAAWAGAWVFIGVRTAQEVQGLRELSDTMVDVGQAVRSSGQTIGTLTDLPFVGERLNEPSTRIVRAGESAIASGRASRESVANLSLLLGVSIAVIPIVPLAVLLFTSLARRRT